LSLFRRLIARLKGKKEKKEEVEHPPSSEIADRKDKGKPTKTEKPTLEPEAIPQKKEPPIKEVYEDSTPPDGSILASSASFRMLCRITRLPVSTVLSILPTSR